MVDALGAEAVVELVDALLRRGFAPASSSIFAVPR